MKYKRVIIGIKSFTLNKEEVDLLKLYKPLGVILFSRNISNKKQTTQLIKDIKTFLGKKCLILIDQEGGRVSRLKINEWPQFPSAQYFGKLAKESINMAKLLVYKNYKLIGLHLFELGVNFNCAPVLDLNFKGANKVIGDRSFSNDPYVVSELSKQACKGLIAAGIIPIIKHIPGHGRSKHDSHKELPVIKNNQESLKKDFYPFEKLNHMPAAMIAHIKYTSLDKHVCATYSKKIISEYIKGQIGFKGILFSDDLCMKALKGSYASRARNAIMAGCDILLHCDPKLSNIYKSITAAGFLSNKTKKDLDKVRSISNRNFN